jgi:hypothetical protein
MKDPKNLLIGLLCVSATILAAVLGVNLSTGAAQAGGYVARGGDYMMYTAAVADGTDLLYIIDVAEQKLNIYYFNPADNALTVRDSMNLKQVFASKPTP